ncbi:DUF5666 domain-containing protein [Vibrio sp. TRT 17S01]|uniref:DUF5666 domain-containing protein n=1 Tax=Vibrio sp. TRT 17S01 TaxID=3418505 RepID=UPI003CE99321
MSRLLVMFTCLMMMACGGGGGESNNTQSIPSSAYGTIDSISGSQITVNGHAYDVSSVNYGATSLSLSDVRKDMIAIVSSGTQTRELAYSNHINLELEPTIAGIISEINYSTGSFKVNGISLTFIGLSSEVENLDWVMVSAFPDGSGGYIVLSVVKFDDSELLGQAEVEGVVSDLTSSTFTIGGLVTVDYSNASILEGDSLANGVWVEVVGTFSGSLFNATTVEVEDFDDFSSDAEIESMITWVADDLSSIQLNYLGYFLINSSTEFEGGAQSDLAVGKLVEVEFIRQADAFIATEIEFEDDDYSGSWGNAEIEFEGVVQSENDASQSFIIRVNGNDLTIFVNENTRYEDGLSFGSLVSQSIEVEVYLVNDQYIAYEVELNN